MKNFELWPLRASTNFLFTGIAAKGLFPGSLAFAAFGLVRWRELRRRARLRRRAQRMPGRKHSPLVAPRSGLRAPLDGGYAPLPELDERPKAAAPSKRLKRQGRRP